MALANSLWRVELTCDHEVIVLAPSREAAQTLAQRCVATHEGGDVHALSPVLEPVDEPRIVAVYPGPFCETALTDIDVRVSL